MATVDTLPIRQIAETGDYVVGKDGSANEEARFAVGTAASLNAGPALTQTLRGDDLENGLATRIGALRKIFRSYDFDGGADIIRILPTGASNQAVSVSFYGVNISSNRATGQINVRLGKDATGVEGSFDAYYRGLQSAKLVTFTHEGQSWVGLQVVGNLGGTGMNEGCFYGAATSAFDPALVVSVYAADVTNLLPFNGGSQVASGRGGDAIGNFSPLRNTNVADMSVATDFPVEPTGTFTPDIRGSLVAGSHTYTNQAGRYVRHGDLWHVSGVAVISSFDATADGDARIGGLPEASVPGDPVDCVTLGAVRLAGSLPANIGNVTGQFLANNTVIALRYFDSADGVDKPVPISAIGAGFVRFTAVYKG